jgi:hypothetical protein
MSNYNYKDARDGTVYVSHTCTDQDQESRQSGGQLRDRINDGGDVTTCTKSTLSIDALGSAYFNGRGALALKANGMSY